MNLDNEEQNPKRNNEESIADNPASDDQPLQQQAGRPSRKKYKYAIAILAIILLLGGCGLSFWRGQDKQVKTPGPQDQLSGATPKVQDKVAEKGSPQATIYDFRDFIEEWNSMAKSYPPQFQLTGDKVASVDALFSALRSWCAPFVRQPTKNYLKQLADLAEETSSSFEAYEKFRKQYYRDHEPDWGAQTNGGILQKTMNDWVLDISAKNLEAKTVKTIIFMNNFCAYFEASREELHAGGIDTNLNTCRELTTNGRYPELDKLLR